MPSCRADVRARANKFYNNIKLKKMKNLRNLKSEDLEGTDVSRLMSGCRVGTGLSEDDCMPFEIYQDFISRGVSLYNIWVCGVGLVNVNAGSDTGSGCGSGSSGSGSAGEGSSYSRDIMDINCVHRTFWHIGFDVYDNNFFDKNYDQIGELYDKQFSTSFVADGGVKQANVKPFFAEYFNVGASIPATQLASEFEQEGISFRSKNEVTGIASFIHAIYKRPDGSLHSVIIEEIKEDGRMDIFDPTNAKHIKEHNVRDAAKVFYGETFFISGVKDSLLKYGSFSGSGSGSGSRY